MSCCAELTAKTPKTPSCKSLSWRSWRLGIKKALSRCGYRRIEEGYNAGGQSRRGEACIVGDSGQDRQPGMRHARSIPPGIALAAAEQLEELGRVRGRQAVG